MTGAGWIHELERSRRDMDERHSHNGEGSRVEPQGGDPGLDRRDKSGLLFGEGINIQGSCDRRIIFLEEGSSMCQRI